MSWLHRRHLQKHMLVVRSLSSFQHVDKSEDAKPGESDGKSILMKGWDGRALPNQIRPAKKSGKVAGQLCTASKHTSGSGS